MSSIISWPLAPKCGIIPPQSPFVTRLHFLSTKKSEAALSVGRSVGSWRGVMAAADPFHTMRLDWEEHSSFQKVDRGCCGG